MKRPRLFHVSEAAGIARFAPRLPPSTDAGVSDPVVWAVAETHLANYLTPRDCPRICYRAGRRTSAADRERFLGEASRVVAVEAAWLDRLNACTLYLYEMPGEAFAPALPEAGYWVSRETVEPVALHVVGDLVSALKARDAELRVLTDFWPLHDAVAASTLEFSILRKRNARRRQYPTEVT